MISITRGILSIFAVLLVLFGVQSQAFAKSDTPLQINVTTDKTSYTETDEITYTLTISNPTTFIAKDVTITSLLPDGLEVTSKDQDIQDNKIVWNTDNIEQNKNVSLTFTAKVKNLEVIDAPIDTDIEESKNTADEKGEDETTPISHDSNDSSTPNNPTNQDNGGNSTSTINSNSTQASGNVINSPQTGDHTNFLGYSILLLISGVVFFLVLQALRKKRLTKGFSALLLIALLLPSFTSASAEESNEVKTERYTYNHSLMINKKEYKLETIVETTWEAPDEVGEEEFIAVTGLAYNNQKELLSNEKLTFSSTGLKKETIETDGNGYFIARLQANTAYQVTGDHLSSTLTALDSNQIKIENTVGEISLGKTLSSGSNQSILQPSTIYLEENQYEIVELASDLTKVVLKGDMELVVGDVFLLAEAPDYPTGLALKALSVSTDGDLLTIQTELPQLEEAFQSIKGNTEVELSSASFIPEPGVKVVENDPQPLFQTRMMTRAARQIELNDDGISLDLYEFTENSPIQLNGKLDLKGKFKGNINWAFELDLVDSWDFSFEGSQTFKGEMLAEINSDGLLDPLRVGRFLVPTSIPGLVVYMPVDVVMEMSGKASIEINAGAKQKIGVRYADGEGMDVYPSDKFEPIFSVSDLKGTASAKLGVQLSVIAKEVGLDLFVASGEAGITGELTTSIVGDSGLFQCAKMESSFYTTFELGVPFFDWNYDTLSFKKKLEEATEGSCVRSISANPSNLELSPGESKSISVTATNELGEFGYVETDKDTSYETSNSDIISVKKNDTNVEVSAAANAQDGDEESVTITYKSAGKEFRDVVTVKVVDKRERGKLVGQVVDAVELSPIKEASVAIYNGDRLVKTMKTEEDGTYSIDLVPATYKVVVSSPSYITDSSNVQITAANTTTYDSKLQLVSTQYEGIGKASGSIINALTGQPVPGITLDIRKGKNNTSGDIVKTITSDETGKYTVDLPGGNYSIGLSGEGYIATNANILVLGGLEKAEQNATISPEGLLGEDIRMVLTWGMAPADLDAHITGPAADGSRFHVYFDNKDFMDENNEVNLDRDDLTYEGPETVTVIKRVNEGTYTYAVHNYSDRFSMTNNFNLANSNATVRVYSGNALLATYNVPLNQEGNTWKVLEVKDGQIVPINQMTYISNFADVNSFIPQSN